MPFTTTLDDGIEPTSFATAPQNLYLPAMQQAHVLYIILGLQIRGRQKVDFDIKSSLDGDVLIASFSGRSTEKNAPAMTTRYFDIVLGSGVKKVLADIRLLKGRLTTTETFFLVRDLPVKPIPAGIKTAVLEKEDRREYAHFLETTSANAGVPFKCFFDREEALSWLRAP